jgi:hypothetical protein
MFNDLNQGVFQMSSIILIMQINLKNMRFQEWVFFGLRFC